MQCERFEQRLHLVLDERGRPEDDLQLRRHAERCPSCRALLAAQTTLWTALEQLELPELPPAFADRAVRQAAQTAVVSRSPRGPLSGAAYPTLQARWRGGRPVMRLAMVAGALTALVGAVCWSLGLFQSPTDQPIAVQQPRANGLAVATPHSPVAEPPLASNVAGPSASPVNGRPTALPRGATDSIAADREAHYAQMLERWRTQLPQLSDSLGLTNADAPAAQGAAAVSQLTESLRMPLSASVQSTLNVLRRALPSSTTEQNRAKPQAGWFPAPEAILA